MQSNYNPFFCLFSLLQIVIIQSKVIFYDNAGDFSNWVTDIQYGYCRVLISDDSECLKGSCFKLEGDAYFFSNPSITSQAIISTANYTNIKLQYYMDGSVEAENQCSLLYSVDGSEFTSIVNITSYNNAIKNETLALPQTANNNPLFKIKFGLYRKFATFRSEWCYVDEIYVLGTPSTITMSTSSPTTAYYTTVINTTYININTTYININTTDININTTDIESYPTNLSNTNITILSPTITDIKTTLTDVYLDLSAENLSKIFKIFLTGFITVFVSIAVCSWIDATFFRINDYFKVGAILSMTVQSADMVSDCFFAMEVSVENEYQLILYASIICIILPALITLFQLYFFIRKYLLQNDYIRAWLSKYSMILLFLSIVTGSAFAAVSLLNSYIFLIAMFDMGLTHKQRKLFQCRRIYSIVLLENVPQLMMQSYYIWLKGIVDNPITVSSIVFSVISIIVSVLSMTLLKTIDNTQSFIFISMDITGDCVEEKARKCRTMKKSLKKRVAVLIGVDESIIEVRKPSYIVNGFALEIHIYANDHDRDIDYGKILMEESNENGKLCKIFQIAWELKELPVVNNINVQMVESKKIMKQKAKDKPIEMKAMINTQ